MSKKISAAAFLAVAVFAMEAVRGADAPTALAALLETKAPSVVSVKAVIKMEISFMGQNQTEESTEEFSAVVIDSSGLVMSSSVPLSGPAGMTPRIRGQEIDMKATPISLKVIFPGDEKEYDAVLGATDSNLNLSFIRIKDLGGKKLNPVDFGDAAAIRVGQELVGVDRIGKGFDYAPFFGLLQVSGEIKQPRPMFSVEGDFGGQGLPIFTLEGKIVGALTMQKGAEGAVSEMGLGGLMGLLSGRGRGIGVNTFLLIPASAIKAVIEKAKPAAEEALKKALEKEAEEAGKGGEGEGE